MELEVDVRADEADHLGVPERLLPRVECLFGAARELQGREGLGPQSVRIVSAGSRHALHAHQQPQTLTLRRSDPLPADSWADAAFLQQHRTLLPALWLRRIDQELEALGRLAREEGQPVVEPLAAAQDLFAGDQEVFEERRAVRLERTRDGALDELGPALLPAQHFADRHPALAALEAVDLEVSGRA